MSQPVNSIKLIPYDSGFLSKSSFTKGEIVYDKDNATLRIMDGATAGGTPFVSGVFLANYVATTLPTTTQRGGVIIPPVGTSAIVNTAGTITIATSTASQKGVVTYDNIGITATNGQLSLLPATSTTIGAVSIPAVGTSGIINTNGVLTLAKATTTQLGAVTVDGTSISATNGVLSYAVNTTQGDITYFDGIQKNVRLPIGSKGQVLTVSAAGIPQWVYPNTSGLVFFVSPEGSDSNTGTSLNNSFASIQKATQVAGPGTTIFIKAGSYYEQLPITVPRACSLIGDSLRDVFVYPKPTGLSLDGKANNLSTMFYVSDQASLQGMTFGGMTGFAAPSTISNNVPQMTGATIGGVYLRLNPASPIITKSPYIRDCSATGSGGIAAYIDGNVHATGYKSMVFWAYNVLIDGGVGIWVTNNGKSECVSVFTYYCYAGYVATFGGKIRSVAGNNSYGTYGAVSIGYDTSETITTGTVYNNVISYASNTLVGNGFNNGETITQASTGAIGTVITVQTLNNIGYIYYTLTTGTDFIGGYGIVGSSSGSTATVLAQSGQYNYLIILTNLTASPVAGQSIQFTGDTSAYVINAVSGGWTGLSSVVQITLAQQKGPASASVAGTQIQLRNNYSQVRLTSHDFLSIGTGGIAATNYPSVLPTAVKIGNQAVNTFPGRVYYISTDQDGNFAVGQYFGVNQATGATTLNANSFNLSGLTSLRLGSIGAQIGAQINEFTTDGTLSQNSDQKVPTEAAIRTFLSNSYVPFNPATGQLLSLGTSSQPWNTSFINSLNVLNQASFNNLITTSSSSFNLFPTNAGVLNFGSASYQLGIGATQGFTTINNNAVFTAISEVLVNTTVAAATVNFNFGATQVWNIISLNQNFTANFTNVPVAATFGTLTGVSAGVAGTYTSVPLKQTSGTGTGAVFNITKTGVGTVYSGFTTITVVTGGSGFNSGDTVTISGANLGGLNNTNDLTFVVSNVTNGVLLVASQIQNRVYNLSLIMNQGGTAYIPTAVQVNGSAVTLNYAGGVQPTGRANKIDVVSLNIWNASGTFYCIGQLSSYG